MFVVFIQSELVGDGFSRSVLVHENLAHTLWKSGFSCAERWLNSWKCTPCPRGKYGRSYRSHNCADCPPGKVNLVELVKIRYTRKASLRCMISVAKHKGHSMIEGIESETAGRMCRALCQYKPTSASRSIPIGQPN